MPIKTVAVLGAGKMGSIVAKDLRDAGYAVTNPDITTGFDLTKADDIARGVAGAEVAVGCVPSAIGTQVMQAALDAGVRKYVDLSFTNDDLRLALKVPTGATVVHDCGLSPGISNLIVGHAAATLTANLSEGIKIWVGGVSKDPRFPNGYVLTWNGDDLIEEYKRPARYRQGRKMRRIDPLSLEAMSTLDVPNVGEMECFVSDGLRSLLETLPVQDMVEYTLRWPGHMAFVREQLPKGRDAFLGAFRSDGADVVVLQVQFGHMVWRMVDYAQDGLSAMARTTAFTCSAFAQCLLEGKFTAPGLHPAEHVGMNRQAYDFVLGKLADHGIDVLRVK